MEGSKSETILRLYVWLHTEDVVQRQLGPSEACPMQRCASSGVSGTDVKSFDFMEKIQSEWLISLCGNMKDVETKFVG